MNFEEAKNQTLNPNMKTKYYNDALTAFDEFSVIKNAEKNMNTNMNFGSTETHGTRLRE